MKKCASTFQLNVKFAFTSIFILFILIIFLICSKAPLSLDHLVESLSAGKLPNIVAMIAAPASTNDLGTNKVS